MVGAWQDRWLGRAPWWRAPIEVASVGVALGAQLASTGAPLVLSHLAALALTGVPACLAFAGLAWRTDPSRDRGRPWLLGLTIGAIGGAVAASARPALLHASAAALALASMLVLGTVVAALHVTAVFLAHLRSPHTDDQLVTRWFGPRSRHQLPWAFWLYVLAMIATASLRDHTQPDALRTAASFAGLLKMWLALGMIVRTPWPSAGSYVRSVASRGAVTGLVAGLGASLVMLTLHAESATRSTWLQLAAAVATATLVGGALNAVMFVVLVPPAWLLFGWMAAPQPWNGVDAPTR